MQNRQEPQPRTPDRSRYRPALVFWATGAAFVSFLLFASRVDLLPLDTPIAMLGGDADLSDSISFVFQMVAYALAVAGFCRFLDLDRALHDDGREAAIALERVRSVATSEDSAIAPLELAPGKPPTLTGRLLRRVRDAGVPSEAERQEAVLESYEDELTAHIEAIAGLQRPCLRLGILGTFLGLALAMLDLRIITDQGVFASSSLFAALQSCFTTSIAGLVGAMVVSTLSSAASRRALALVFRWRELMQAADTAGVRAGFAPDDANATRRALKAVTQCIVEQTMRIEDQTRTIRSGLGALQIEKNELDRFLAGVASIRQSVLEEIRTIRAHIEPKTWAAAIDREFSELLQVVTARMEKHLKGALGGVHQATTTLETSRRALEVAANAALSRSSGIGGHHRNGHSTQNGS